MFLLLGFVVLGRCCCCCFWCCVVVVIGSGVVGVFWEVWGGVGWGFGRVIGGFVGLW